MSDLFIRLMKGNVGKEDFFTECLAATLQGDRELARYFLVSLCGEELEGVPIAASSPAVETQVSYCGSCVDIVFRLSDGKCVGVENKLFSPEGAENSRKTQLLKYLDLPLTRLAFVTGYHTSVEDKVLASPRYLRPNNRREHFLWSDFYEILEASVNDPSATILNRALLSLFAHFGFEPPVPQIGDLHDPDTEVADRNRKNFAKLWEVTRQGLRSRGWRKFIPCDKAGLDVQRTQALTSRLESAWLDPVGQRGSLRIRLNAPEADLSAFEAELTSSGFPHHHDITVLRTNAVRVRERKEVKVPVLDVLISMNRLLGDCTDADASSRTLADFTLAVFDAVN